MKSSYKVTCLQMHPGLVLCTKMFLFVMLIVTPLLGWELLSPTTVSAQSAWQASYWDNATLSGNPVLTRQELSVDHNWGGGSPDPTIDGDTFSARWTRSEQLVAGTYRFTATVDDGIRVWVDGVRIIDEWEERSRRTVDVDLFLEAGNHDFQIDFFELGGVAYIQFNRELLDAAPALTPEPTATRVADEPLLTEASWRAEYYDNTTLSGTPALVRGENNIDFLWGLGSPALDIIGPDTFSARWTRTLNLNAGRYRFAVTVDDGVRLYVNGQLVIDQWRDQAPTTYSTELDLPGGVTNVRMEYYENLDRATARFSYAEILSQPTPVRQSPQLPVQNADWRGEYFDNVNLSAPPAFVRIDDAINFDWGSGSPAPNRIGNDRFSVRWTTTLNGTPGRYRFEAFVDDGVRLRVNGQTLIDEFTVQSATRYAAEAVLTDGRAVVEMEYFEDTGQAVARLSWQLVDGGTTAPAQPDLPVNQPVALVISSGNLNVRSGPGVGFEIIDRLARSQTVEMVGRNRTSTWIQILLPDGRSGWVNRQFLDSNFAIDQLRVAG